MCTVLKQKQVVWEACMRVIQLMLRWGVCICLTNALPLRVRAQIWSWMVLCCPVRQPPLTPLYHLTGHCTLHTGPPSWHTQTEGPQLSKCLLSFPGWHHFIEYKKEKSIFYLKFFEKQYFCNGRGHRWGCINSKSYKMNFPVTEIANQTVKFSYYIRPKRTLHF